MQEILFTQFHIMRNYNHRRSSDKIWAQEGRLFRWKVVIFPNFSSVITNFFSLIGLISFIDPLRQKIAKSLVLEVARVLKLTLFSVRPFKSLTLAFSPEIFPLTPTFFRILTIGLILNLLTSSCRCVMHQFTSLNFKLQNFLSLVDFLSSLDRPRKLGPYFRISVLRYKQANSVNK